MAHTAQQGKNTGIYRVHKIDKKTRVVWIDVVPRGVRIPFVQVNGEIKSRKKQLIHQEDRFYGNKKTYLPKNMYVDALKMASAVMKDHF